MDGTIWTKANTETLCRTEVAGQGRGQGQLLTLSIADSIIHIWEQNPYFIHKNELLVDHRLKGEKQRF